MASRERPSFRDTHEWSTKTSTWFFPQDISIPNTTGFQYRKELHGCWSCPLGQYTNSLVDISFNQNHSLLLYSTLLKHSCSSSYRALSEHQHIPQHQMHRSSGHVHLFWFETLFRGGEVCLKIGTEHFIEFSFMCLPQLKNGQRLFLHWIRSHCCYIYLLVYCQQSSQQFGWN